VLDSDLYIGNLPTSELKTLFRRYCSDACQPCEKCDQSATAGTSTAQLVIILGFPYLDLLPTSRPALMPGDTPQPRSAYVSAPSRSSLFSRARWAGLRATGIGRITTAGHARIDRFAADRDTLDLLDAEA
jgi:hypothetical protein